MASAPRFQFSLRTFLAATFGICVMFATLRWAAITVALLALVWFLLGLSFITYGPSDRRRVVRVGLGAIAVLTTLVDFAIPLITSVRGAIGAFAIGLSFAAPLLHGVDWKQKIRSLAVFFLWLLVLSRAPWDPRKPFWRAYESIEPGMTQEQVERQFRRQFAGKLPDHRYKDNNWFYYLDLNDGRYNAEIISINVSDGRVVKADYLPD